MDPTPSNSLSDEERALIEALRVLTDPQVRAAALLLLQACAENANTGGA